MNNIVKGKWGLAFSSPNIVTEFFFEINDVPGGSFNVKTISSPSSATQTQKKDPFMRLTDNT